MSNPISIKNYQWETGVNVLHSHAGCSTFFFHHSSRTLFDCGDGCVTILGQAIFAVENIFITHEHLDHCCGIINFIAARLKWKGDNAKKINIFCPNANKLQALIKNLVNYGCSSKELDEIVNLKQISDGDAIEIRRGLVVHARDSEHTNTSLVYFLVRHTKKLNEKGQELVDGKNFAALDASCYRENHIPIFAFLTDCPRYKREWLPLVEGAAFAIFDSTFLNPEDRTRFSHADINQCVSAARLFKVGQAFFAHISHRYDIRPAVEKYGSQNTYIVPPNKTISFNHNI